LGRVPQAGGIVVRKDGDRLSVLLVRAKKDPGVWIFPKGHIEPGESAADAAVRETREEAGIEGESVGPIGEPLEFNNGRYDVSVQYFLIRPVSECAECEDRAKQWFSIDEAVDALQWEEARALVKLAAQRITSARARVPPDPR
jgi:diadenosine hexaphosphate hydrolase (ATP-forming)